MSFVAQWLFYFCGLMTAVIVVLLVMNAYRWSRYDGTTSEEAQAVQRRILQFQKAKPILLTLLVANVLVLTVLLWFWVGSMGDASAESEPATNWKYMRPH
jgi:hypothetical protein